MEFLTIQSNKNGQVPSTGEELVTAFNTNFQQLAQKLSDILDFSYTSEDQDENNNIIILLGSTVISGATRVKVTLYEDGIEVSTSGIVKPIFAAGVIESVILLFDAPIGSLTGFIESIK